MDNIYIANNKRTHQTHTQHRMIRILFIISTAFISIQSMAQTKTFSQCVNDLFFGVDVSSKSASILDNLLSMPELHYSEVGARQWNINISMAMQSHKALSTKHQFTFSHSPLPGLKIENGIIEATLGETDSVRKLLDLGWRLQFSDKASATKYFDTLKQIFGDSATEKKIEHNKHFGEIAQFATRNHADSGIKDITLFLEKSATTKNYEILLVFGSEFMEK